MQKMKSLTVWNRESRSIVLRIRQNVRFWRKADVSRMTAIGPNQTSRFPARGHPVFGVSPFDAYAAPLAAAYRQ